jgi:hypothetical protein
MRSSRRDPLGALFSRLILVGLVLLPASARAQAIEVAGSRAPGMGGAFVAVASDSSATWWNPAGLAAGPFLDFAIYRNALEGGGQAAPAWRARLLDFSLGTPPAGISYYRFRLTDVQPLATTATGQGDRQSTRTGAIRSIPASQLGVTLAHSLISGIHVGATLKYVRASVMAAAGDGTSDQLLDAGDDLDGADSHGTFDLDLQWADLAFLFSPQANANDPPLTDGPSLSTALQEQLGLKLESTKAPVDVLVIDHVAKPTAD